jgi:hypothetical protein
MNKYGQSNREVLLMYMEAPSLLIPALIVRTWRKIRHPFASWYIWKKWHDRPAVGDYVRDCRGEISLITHFGDNEDMLEFADGSGASWMNCCEKVTPISL